MSYTKLGNNNYDAFMSSAKQHRKDLLAKDTRVKKIKDNKGNTVVTLTMSPKYFAYAYREAVTIINLASKSKPQQTYLNEEWNKELLEVKKTGEIYHPAFKGLCPVLFNAKRNPIYLRVDDEELFARGITCALVYINKIVATKAPKSDVYHFKLYTKAVMVDDEQGFHRVDSDVFEYKNSYSDAEPLFKLNGDRCYDGVYLGILMNLLRVQRLIGRDNASIHKEYMVFRRFIEDKIPYWLLDNLIAKTMQLRKYELFDDLPFSEIQLLHVYGLKKEARNSLLSSIYTRLRHGSTVDAVDMCFFGYKYPKSIKKVMLKLGFLNHYKSYSLVYEAVNAVGTDKVLSYIRNEDGSPNIKVFSNGMFLRSLIMGFTGYPHALRDKTPKTRKHKEKEWRDTSILHDAVYMMKQMSA